MSWLKSRNGIIISLRRAIAGYSAHKLYVMHRRCHISDIGDVSKRAEVEAEKC